MAKRRGTSGDDLGQEIEVYEREKRGLLDQGNRGKYVLVYHKKVQGVFESREDGLAKGYERFGNAPFLVRQILEQQPVLHARPIRLNPS